MCFEDAVRAGSQARGPVGLLTRCPQWRRGGDAITARGTAESLVSDRACRRDRGRPRGREHRARGAHAAHPGRSPLDARHARGRRGARDQQPRAAFILLGLDAARPPPARPDVPEGSATSSAGLRRRKPRDSTSMHRRHRPRSRRRASPLQPEGSRRTLTDAKPHEIEFAPSLTRGPDHRAGADREEPLRSAADPHG